MEDYGIVEYFYEHSGHRCGYCKSESSSFSCGMWAHRLTAGIYDDLINRGWRRSGEYCYKPMMKQTCCCQYAIKLDVQNFKISKSQKKILKRMNRFLATGKGRDELETRGKDDHSFEPAGDTIMELPDFFHKKSDLQLECSTLKQAEGTLRNPNGAARTEAEPLGSQKNMEDAKHHESAARTEAEPLGSQKNVEDAKHHESAAGTIPRKGLGPDPSKPRCQKASVIRREKWLKKMAEKGIDSSSLPEQGSHFAKKPKNEPKTLEDFVFESLPNTAAHRLEVRTVRLSPQLPEFDTTFLQSWEVFRKYQQAIHKESESQCDRSSYRRFLVDSPLQFQAKGSYNLGSFHQQYWLDDELIAVGVIDVLPTCVSSVYLFYNPDYSFLSLGTYASLREIAFTRELCKLCPKIKNYCMGFYIHTCPKMRYKGNFSPSYLLCPETYTWHPIEKCKPLLDASRYTRFEQDEQKEDENAVSDLSEVSILFNRKVISYKKYRRLNGNEDKAEIEEYASLVGAKCIKPLFLYRSS